MSLNVSDLNRKIILQRAIYTANDLNEKVPTWVTLTVVWASKKDVSDSERIAAQQIAATITTRFQIRYSTIVADLNPKDRINFDGKIYDISVVKEIGRKQGLEISASARTDA